ncbi:MAG: hypothetical protein LKJ17_05305 [Oscillospiraceae bacterium]|jgi:hypothetical protein|nr:hypothetical protein [Oscillospiraceae bacterium]
MAKFCVYCGRPLEEGEVCQCRNISAQATPLKAEEKVAQANILPSKAGKYVQGLWHFIRQSFQAPVQAMRSFAASADVNEAFGLIGIQAIAFGLFMVVLCSKLSDVLTTALYGGLSSIGSLFSWASGNLFENSDAIADLGRFPMGKIFFLSLLLAAVSAFLFAGILLMFSKVFKGQTTYRHMLCVSGANSLASAPFLLLGIVGLWINFELGIGIACLSLFLQPYFTLEALNGLEIVEKDKSVYFCFLSFAVLALAMLLVAKQIYPQYLPTGLTSLLDEAKVYADDASGVLGEFFGNS